MDVNQLIEFLNLSDKDGLFSNADLLCSTKSIVLSNRVKNSLKILNPNYFYCINNEPLILFFEDPKDPQELQKQIWNFNQAPAVFIKENDWVIKNGFNLLDNKKELETITNNVSDFQYFEIISGRTWKNYKTFFDDKKRVDYYLLNNIETARNLLTEKEFLNPKLANSLIGRVIFIRYLIDKNVELNNYNIVNKEDFYKLLSNKEDAYKFFKQIRDDFNGNLFPLEYEINNKKVHEFDYVNQNHLNIIINLLKGDKLSPESIQTSLFDIYDFSIIPIEFISNVYEKFIGIENQAKKGAYYTPLFLVDYIQKETVSVYFKRNPLEYNCKVLDPACGSGIFLVETLRQIISQYQENNPDYLKEENLEGYKRDLKKLLVNNIYGVDKDEDAISVAIFSLYITLLDNLKPMSIVGFKFPDLIGTNFFVNDFFDTDQEFNKKLKKNHFQFILGNPPWATKHIKEKQLFERYVENRKIAENSNLEIENREIAEAFLVRVSDFNFDETAFIVVSKILYKISRKSEKRGVFRKYFLDNFDIRQVFELSSVRHHVFDRSNDKAIAPATILFYGKKTSDKNIIKHISLKPNIFFETFKLLVIEKYDVKKIAQEYFALNDWLWKVLVYGNVLDYYFLQRLKQNNSIYEFIEENFLFGKGISIGGGDENSIKQHKKIKKSINSKEKGLKPYNIKYTSNFLVDKEFVHRPRNIELFKAPLLLVGKGVTSDFKLKSAISLQDVIYTDAITGLKPLTATAHDMLYLLEALFNSNLFSYFLINTNSSIGIEREQSHDKDDKFSIPLAQFDSDNINKLKEKTNLLRNLLEKLDKKEFEDFDKIFLRLDIENLKEEIEIILLSLYKVTKQEMSLINFNSQVIIPLLKGSSAQSNNVVSKLEFNSPVLEDYALIFIEHFGKRFFSNNNFFEVEIVYSNHTILMKFKIIPHQSKSINSIVWKKDEDKNLLLVLANLGFDNLSYNLYLQKDIKGFEEDFFYVAKPNQYKSWHEAIAYLDLSEFVEAFFEISNS